jgi:hypothetical protein
LIEILFSESAAASLACAKEDGSRTAGIALKLVADGEGNISSESCESKPYAGPTIAGSQSDIVPLWLLADIGDISDLPDSHVSLWRKIQESYASQDNWTVEDNWAEKEVNRVNALIDRFRESARTEEPVRIWWSDAPGEICGFYWAMNIIKDSVGPVTSVKLPPCYSVNDGYTIFNGTGDLSPEWFSKLLGLERSVKPAERKAVAFEWNKLAAENAPLRAVINGHLYSVPIDFYDFVLQRFINNTGCRVIEIIGKAISSGPIGISDWWYAWRLQAMIDSGKLKMVKKNKTFYASIIKPSG